ncbi:40-kDa huntingtin-associated protein-like isoform X1 [Branchiostoma lanceolatum]|uniref:40-kDa huntingtin-associated protein-like isoform X1 n=1 Tax=Branchiostoma lanceolatum TaxID=7740 RepID=UPI001132CD2B
MEDVDFLTKYRAVSSKLKKRFLRKPNVAEASEQFGSLSKDLLEHDNPHYAGFCCLAMARCEQTLSNSPGESHALVEAARLFLEAECTNQMLKCPGFEEHLIAAMNCYNFAIKVHIEQTQPAMAACLCLELGNALRGLNKPDQAMSYYQRAADLQYQNPLDCLESLGLVASCKIQTRDYDGALTIFTEMAYLAQERGASASGPASRPIGAFCDILARCEVTRVLLLMLLQPTPQRIRPEHAQTLERYAWESHSEDSAPVNCLSEEVFLLLQSTVMACQSRDVSALKSLQKDLWPHLTAEQNHLLHLVIQEMEHPSGEGI